MENPRLRQNEKTIAPHRDRFVPAGGVSARVWADTAVLRAGVAKFTIARAVPAGFMLMRDDGVLMTKCLRWLQFRRA